MRIVTVVGARPQFIKAAAVSRAVRTAQATGENIEEVLVHTGQHYDADLSEVFFEDLALPVPAHELQVGSGPHGKQTARMLERLEPVLIRERPTGVLVYGDTNSTLAAALAAAKLSIPIAHVEAGMRSGRRDMPEEVNRVVTDHLSSLCLCSSELAAANLAREGITDSVITGDVMLDVLESHLDEARNRSEVLEEFGVSAGAYAFATLHRSGNTDVAERLDAILEGIARVGLQMQVVFAFHPRTRIALGRRKLPGGVIGLTPQPYLRTLTLVANARVVMTDSGGLQKEAYWLGVPCVTLREETEWPETLLGGWNVLAGTSPDLIEAGARRSAPKGARPAVYGSGGASDRIVSQLLRRFG